MALFGLVVIANARQIVQKHRDFDVIWAAGSFDQSNRLEDAFAHRFRRTAQTIKVGPVIEEYGQSRRISAQTLNGLVGVFVLLTTRVWRWGSCRGRNR
jgi:hypothetical protein